MSNKLLGVYDMYGVPIFIRFNITSFLRTVVLVVSSHLATLPAFLGMNWPDQGVHTQTPMELGAVALPLVLGSRHL